MLDSLVVFLTKIWLNVLMLAQVFSLEALIEINCSKKGILSYNFVKDVEVEGQFIDRFYSFQHFATKWTLNLVIT
jgi:hypothetical protein